MSSKTLNYQTPGLLFSGDTLNAPIIMAPVAAHGLANVKAEKASAKGVARFGTIYTASSYASCTLRRNSGSRRRTSTPVVSILYEQR